MNFQYRGPLEPGSPLFQGRQDEANTLLDACQQDVKEYQIFYENLEQFGTRLAFIDPREILCLR